MRIRYDRNVKSKTNNKGIELQLTNYDSKKLLIYTKELIKDNFFRKNSSNIENFYVVEINKFITDYKNYMTGGKAPAWDGIKSPLYRGLFYIGFLIDIPSFIIIILVKSRNFIISYTPF